MNVYTVLILTIIMADIGFGLMSAWANNEFRSSVARRGIAEHFSISIVIVLAYYFTRKMHVEYILDYFEAFLLFAYGVSILKNLKKLGVPIPEYLETRMEKELEEKSKGDKNG